MAEEEVIGFLSSKELKSGRFGRAGFSLYLTKNQIRIARPSQWFKFTDKGANLEKGLPRGITRDDVEEVVKKTDENRDFEATLEDIEQMELKKPGIIGLGHFSVKTPGTKYKVDIGTGGDKEYKLLKGILKNFAPDKLRIEE